MGSPPADSLVGDTGDDSQARRHRRHLQAARRLEVLISLQESTAETLRHMKGISDKSQFFLDLFAKRNITAGTGGRL